MRKNIRVVLLAGAALSSFAVPAMAQSRSATPATPPPVQALPPQPDPRVTLLEQQLRDVRAEIENLKQAQADSDNSLALSDLKRATGDQYVDINSQLAALPKVALDNGRFTVASADGRFTLALRALVQFDAGYFAQGKGPASVDLSSGANFRRAQIGVTGTAWRDWSYWTMPVAAISLESGWRDTATVATFAITRWVGESETSASCAACCFCCAVWGLAVCASAIFLISCMPQMGQAPGVSLMMNGCIAQV